MSKSKPKSIPNPMGPACEGMLCDAIELADRGEGDKAIVLCLQVLAYELADIKGLLREINAK